MASGAEFSVEHNDGESAIAIAGPTLISVWYGPPAANGVSALRRVQSKLLRERDPFGGLVLVLDFDGRIVLPAEPVRRELASTYEETRGRRVFSAIAIETTGFLAATVRGFITGLGVISRSTTTQRVFAARRPALEWMVSSMANAGRPLDLEAYLQGTGAMVESLLARSRA
jgi:hypothetical protein